MADELASLFLAKFRPAFMVYVNGPTEAVDDRPHVNVRPQISFRNLDEMVTKLGYAVVEENEYEQSIGSDTSLLQLNVIIDSCMLEVVLLQNPASLDMVAVPQAPSPESNPHSPLPVASMVDQIIRLQDLREVHNFVRKNWSPPVIFVMDQMNALDGEDDAEIKADVYSWLN
ncbi:hypothetical protein FQN50_002392 [Emmonsiellopsis sp. PD_5]|nr:hypothetical protein FQN50_002392 [Emmonsiellopsis sp. PD_5]